MAIQNICYHIEPIITIVQNINRLNETREWYWPWIAHVLRPGGGTFVKENRVIRTTLVEGNIRHMNYYRLIDENIVSDIFESWTMENMLRKVFYL